MKGKQLLGLIAWSTCLVTFTLALTQPIVEAIWIPLAISTSILLVYLLYYIVDEWG